MDNGHPVEIETIGPLAVSCNVMEYVIYLIDLGNMRLYDKVKDDT